MHTHEFCYWIQGYFELREDSSDLTRKQMDCILRHIMLVEKVDKNTSGQFINWLRGVIDSVSVIDQVKKITFEDFSSEITEIIKQKLHDCFEHEIDGKYKIEGLGQLHHPSKQDPYTKQIRC